MNKTTHQQRHWFVLFGATGDLASRMLFPSLFHLHCDGLLPASLRIIASGQNQLEQAEFGQMIRKSLQQSGASKQQGTVDADTDGFMARIAYLPVDAGCSDDFDALARTIEYQSGDEFTFYMSTSSKFYSSICKQLQRVGLITNTSRVVMEKPIGHDLQSCAEINRQISGFFPESAIFRVDHYLGKETVQNLLALRFANALFEPLWNAADIDHVQITAAEQVGVEGRWSYYDDAGAMRDMVQNHLLQLLCLVAMEPPSHLEPDAVRNEKVKVLRSLRPIGAKEIKNRVVFGQYTVGSVGEGTVSGYQDEPAGAVSDTETFVALRADIDNWRWKGVPFYLRTGKRMPYRYTEIFIQFREVPHDIFGGNPLTANKLIIRLQPEENIRLLIMNKVPGLDHSGQMQLRPLPLDLTLADGQQGERRRIAYERLLLDVIRNDSTLFVRRDEVETAWAWVDQIMHAQAQSGEVPRPYRAGSWGPASAIALTERDGRSWHE